MYFFCNIWFILYWKHAYWHTSFIIGTRFMNLPHLRDCNSHIPALPGWVWMGFRYHPARLVCFWRRVVSLTQITGCENISLKINNLPRHPSQKLECNLAIKLGEKSMLNTRITHSCRFPCTSLERRERTAVQKLRALLLLQQACRPVRVILKTRW
jgi:hypothetical protein